MAKRVGMSSCVNWRSYAKNGSSSLAVVMRMKLTKKIMAPELVQECPGEVVGVAFHEAERFGGHGLAVGAAPAPPPNHPCWERGWVLLDRLPLYVEFRVDEATEDYTGLGRPGVWFLGPVARGSVARELRAL